MLALLSLYPRPTNRLLLKVCETSMYEKGVVTQRNRALDFSKGVLVLFMVLYHWINYFVGVYGPIYTYLRFIPPSFVFITGFLIANVYPARYGLSSVHVYRRLIVRGGKLLLLFLFLNIAANLVFVKSYKGAMPGVEGFFRDLVVILTTGNAKAAFSILVPISYLLFLAAVIFMVGRPWKRIIPLMCFTAFVSIAVLEMYGGAGSTLPLLGIGTLGMFLGMYPIEKVESRIDYPVVVVSLNAGYVLAIGLLGSTYPVQAIGVVLSIALIYLAGMRSDPWYGIKDLMVLLGQYSLFGYVAQICLLQLLQQGLSQLRLTDWNLWVTSFLGAFALTIVAVKGAESVRAKFPLADRFYKLTFT